MPKVHFRVPNLTLINEGAV